MGDVVHLDDYRRPGAKVRRRVLKHRPPEAPEDTVMERVRDCDRDYVKRVLQEATIAGRPLKVISVEPTGGWHWCGPADPADTGKSIEELCDSVIDRLRAEGFFDETEGVE